MTQDADRETAASQNAGEPKTDSTSGEKRERPGNANNLEGPKRSHATPSQSNASDWSRAKPQGPQMDVEKQGRKENPDDSEDEGTS